jgi:hypothetical protein
LFTHYKITSIGSNQLLPYLNQRTRSGVLELEVLIRELVSVDALSAGAVVGCEVASLAHEVWDDAVEGAALVAEALLASAQGTEVLSSLGDNVGVKLEA